MANVTTIHHMFCDTAEAIFTGNKRIIGVYWVSDQVAGDDIAADDDFLLSNAAGARFIGKRAEAAGDGLEVTFGYPGVPVVGLTLTTLDGGVVYIITAGE